MKRTELKYTPSARKNQIDAAERVVKALGIERWGDVCWRERETGVPCLNQPSEWHHEPPKGMGKTYRIYQLEGTHRLVYLCQACHWLRGNRRAKYYGEV